MRDWQSLKDRLVAGGHLRSAFLDLQKHEWPTPSESRYDPLQIDRQIQRVSEEIDRCLHLRRDIRELEILAVKSAAEYDLFLKTSPIDEEIEKSRLFLNARKLESEGEKEASLAFGDESPMTSGLRARSLGRGSALDEEVRQSSKMESLIASRWSEVRDYQDSFRDRFNQPGNAHNYAERAEKLLMLLQREVEEALERAVALRAGLETVYDWLVPALPETVSIATLDEFLVWVLDVRRELSVRSESEDVFELVVPLCQPWLPNGSSLVSSSVFQQAFSRAPSETIKLSFELPSISFFGEKVRLRGLGISFGNAFDLVPSSGIDAAQTADSFVRMSLKVALPVQRLASGRNLDRRPLFLGNVGLHAQSHPLAFVSGPQITNIDPIGRWSIEINQSMVWKDSGKYSASEGIRSRPIQDLKMTFQYVVNNSSHPRSEK